MRSEDDWNKNLKIIAQWSPYSIEELFKQVKQVRSYKKKIPLLYLYTTVFS